MADERRAQAEALALGAGTKFKDPSSFASRIDELMETLEADEELRFVCPFTDGLEKLMPTALFTVTDRRVLVHTGSFRSKLIEFDPERIENMQGMGRGLLSPNRLVIFLDDGSKREIHFDTKEEVIAAFDAVAEEFGEEEEEE